MTLNMKQEFQDFEIEAQIFDDGRIELVIHDLQRKEHRAITIQQNPEEVADRLENAAEGLREEHEWRMAE